jgi:PAS domain S-box-containing protein
MPSTFRFGDYELRELAEDAGRVLCRGWRVGPGGSETRVLGVLTSARLSDPLGDERLVHEYALRDDLNNGWAARPFELVREKERTLLVLEDPGGEPLHLSRDVPMELGTFLTIAIAIAEALGNVHAAGLVHKDIKPSNLLVDFASGAVWLTGFGIASRLPRERQAVGPPELIAGTLAYMAPEQTGRMNRSVDSRSDLYACGVTYYQALTGALPFSADDPMGWIHCHVARQATPPTERVQSIPHMLSALVMKLLAKAPDERYQTASGVAADLRRCQAEWAARGTIESFPLGRLDVADRLVIPESLYGRQPAIDRLLAAFARVVAGGQTELVLVSGYSGIGKSSVVSELHKALVSRRGLFAAGKFEQYKRNIPYATLAQAFQSLTRALLGKGETELSKWRDALRVELGENAQLIVHIVPELEFLIGKQPPVLDLPPQQAKTRFQTLFRRFVKVFATAEHPLVLFLDDLQWLDEATLGMLEYLATDPEVRHLLLIGAYRDNEVSLAHPLTRMLDNLRQNEAIVEEIWLAPLIRQDLSLLVADAFSCDIDRADPLARLVHEKTGGNPFFAIQFVSELVEEGLIGFDRDGACWRWELDRIHGRRHTDNVVDLMVEKINRLSIETKDALQKLSCFGNAAEVSMFAILLGKSNDAARADLWDAILLDLVQCSEGAYKFSHDRIQEAAYSLMSERPRAEMHLRIGRLFATNGSAEKRLEATFDIVNQLNRGMSLITSGDEREELAEFNLVAGSRAQATTAYASALGYFSAGLALLPEDRWVRRHELTFSLELHRAECEFLTGQPEDAEKRLEMLVSQAANTVEKSTIERLSIDVYTVLDQTGNVVNACLAYLRQLGIDWPSHPTEQEARREYDRIWALLGGRAIEGLIEQPLMIDPESLAILDVLTKLYPTATLMDANLLCVAVCRAINLSLERGHCDASCVAYVHFGTIAGPRFGNYQAASRFGQLAWDLVDKRGLKRFQARTYHWLAQFVLPWATHLKACRGLTRQAYQAATEAGDLSVAVYCSDILNTHYLATGDPLAETQIQAENGLEFAKKTRFGHQIDVQSTQLAIIRNLRGLTDKFGCLDNAQYSEALVETHVTPHPAVYWVRKLQARFFAGDYSSALDAAARARPNLWTLAAMFEEAEFHFYAALALTRSYISTVADRDNGGESVASEDEVSSSVPAKHHMQALAIHHRQLETWASNCLENFENRAALVGAEIARLEGRELDAERLYHLSIRSAKANGFTNNEALAYELAAGFYAARGLGEIAHLYLRNARNAYLRWGADGKALQLESIHPQLRRIGSMLDPTSTILASLEHLDLATIIKVSQAVSAEIIPDRLIVTLMRVAVEHAGAERGVLILSRKGELRIEAEATASGDDTVVRLLEMPVTGSELPAAIVQYAARTQETVILEDGEIRNPFSTDPYVRQRRARSILCLPLVKQGVLIGILYLENNLIARVFTPNRVAVLKLLASQAAISLENMHLYTDLEEREAKVRRLVDANIVGIFIWNSLGEIIEANKAFLQMVGYGREDVEVGGLSWGDLTPLDSPENANRVEAALNTTEIAAPFERELLRKDGSRLSVLFGEAAFGRQRSEGVAFVVDLTERNRAEAEFREGERKYREIQVELEHANRVATMGQLSASIAHEVTQPIAAALTNADTALRWLMAQPPNIEKVRQALVRIAENGNRAAEVIGSIRALIKKDPPRMGSVQINETIREVITLAQGEVLKSEVSLRTELAERLPPVRGDKVQLQQVLLNLIINAAEAVAGSSATSGDLLITTSESEFHDVLVSVADSGPGLPSGSHERLFDAFYTTKSSGLGMGLPICRTIIEAHGGRLWATANLPRGAVFQFTVPSRLVAN